jgi:pimeloyl-ACP methyl ester carboxylesterase
MSGLALLGPALAGAAAWTAAGYLDRRRIAADPMRERLAARLGGEVVHVRSADGTILNARIFGRQDAATVVLVHGWTCALGFWTCQIQELARDFRVVAYDLRGHGGSQRARAGDYSMLAHAADLDAILRACVPPGERPVVAGHSLGAMTLVAWAGERRHHVSSRIAAAALVSTGLHDLVTETLVLRAPARLGRLQQKAGRALLSASAPLPTRVSAISHRAVRYVALSPWASPATVAFCEQVVLACRRDVRAACGATVSELDLRESITSLDVPAVAIAGERDKLTPPVHTRRLADALPRPADYIEIPRVGHMTPVEAPQEVTAAIRSLAVQVTLPASVAV